MRMNLANLPGGDEEEVDDEVEVSLQLHGVEIREFFCHSDFT